MIRKPASLIVSFSLVLLTAGCNPGAEKTPTAETAARKIPNVSVEQVGMWDLEEKLVLSGTLAPYREMVVTAETAGVAERIIPKKGDRVREGDLLAEIDRKNSESALDRAQAALRQVTLAREEADLGVKRAEAQLATADIGLQQAKLALAAAEKFREKADIALANMRTQFERVEKLYRDKLASQAAHDDARTALKTLEADAAAAAAAAENAREAIRMAESSRETARLGVDSARLRVPAAQAEIESQAAAVAQAELHLEKGLLTAPFDGLVDDIFFEQGEYVKMELPVMRLISGTELSKVKVALSEQDVSHVRRGQEARVSIPSNPGGEPLTGRVSWVALSSDARTNTYPAEITVPNPGGTLKAGMVAEVRLVRRKVAGAVVAPAFAVIPKEEGKVAFVLERGRAVRRKVTAGIEEGGWVQVVDGLRAGEQLIVKGQRDLQDGQEVKVP